MKNKKSGEEEKQKDDNVEDKLITIQNEKKSPADDRAKSKVSRAVDIVSHRYQDDIIDDDEEYSDMHRNQFESDLDRYTNKKSHSTVENRQESNTQDKLNNDQTLLPVNVSRHNQSVIS